MRYVQQGKQRRTGIDHLRRRKVHGLHIPVGRRIQFRIVEFVLVHLQLHAQLPQTSDGLFIIVGRNALLVKKLLRASYFVFKLVVLDLQCLDAQSTICVVQLGK